MNLLAKIIITKIAGSRYGKYLPDKWYLQVLYETKMGKPLNLNNPLTFNEKLQWIKLYDRRPEYTTMVDKYAVKNYVASIIGDEYIIPTFGVWNRGEDINWNILPDRFVLKCSHDSGGLVICQDKSSLDREATVTKLNECLKRDYYSFGREWPYKNVPRRIIAEALLEPRPVGYYDIPVYKWYCINGEPRYCQEIQDHQTKDILIFNTKVDHQTDAEFTSAAMHPDKPISFETQFRIAKELSKSSPFSEIDLRETQEGSFFCDVYSYPASGFEMFRSDQYNSIVQEMVKQPGIRRSSVTVRQLHNNEIVFSQPDLPDYKFFCFDGVVKAMFIATDRQNRAEPYFDFYDAEFNYLDLRHGHPNAPVRPEKPLSFDLMKDLASKISKGLAECRVDFYEVNGRPFFGEITLFHHGGFMPFEPSEWDRIFGDWIILPRKSTIA